jgi:hypothetical protein
MSDLKPYQFWYGFLLLWRGFAFAISVILIYHEGYEKIT